MNPLVEENAEQRLAKDVSAMHDSVSTLNQLMQEAFSEERNQRITANYSHLEIMIAKLGTVLTEEQKSLFLDSVSEAKTFLN